MTEINYVRNLSGACLTVVRGAPQLGLPIPPHGKQWGFCSIRSWLAACRRRVAALMMQFPPRLVAVSPQFAVVLWPNCRPIG